MPQNQQICKICLVCFKYVLKVYKKFKNIADQDALNRHDYYIEMLVLHGYRIILPTVFITTSLNSLFVFFSKEFILMHKLCN